MSEKRIAAAVITDRDRVLLVRRRQREGSLLWSFPAGEVEAGEEAAEAAVRETAEETGLIVTAQGVLGERTHPATHRQMSYIACDVISGEAVVADAEELDAVEWCRVADLPAYVPHGFFGPVQQYLDSVLVA